MKIGIGITTFQRPEHLNLCIQQIETHTKNYKFFVFEDLLKTWVAHAKNECLRHLRDCDYIFLFDDDCFPIKDGWVDYFIKVHKETGQHHLLYAKQTPSIKWKSNIGEIDIWDNCGGCFMFLTKEVIEKVGGFNSEYGRYGYEHAGYSTRIFKSGLNTYAPFISAHQTRDYIYSLDYDNHKKFKIKHKPSVSFGEVMGGLPKNREVYLKDIETVYHEL
jgi:GT2 family glycosyltransferase